MDSGAHLLKPKIGRQALSPGELKILDWDEATKLTAFKKANEGEEKVTERMIREKIMYIETLTQGNGEIYDVLRIQPNLSWEKIMSMFTSNLHIDGMTSTLHMLGTIKYPSGFWKALIENEREKILNTKALE